MLRALQTDVAIVGAGMAGLCAAITALEHGARVLVIEKGTRFGGSMRLSAGLIWTFADKDQLRQEIPDGNQALQDLVVDGLWESLDWLESQGVVLSPPRSFMWYGRGRNANPPEMTTALVSRVEALGGQALAATGMSALVAEDGSVTRLVARGPDGLLEVEAGSVVLATGGFQGNAELLARYITPYADRIYLRGNPWSTGDAFLAATQLGAAVTPWLETFYGHALAAPPARFGPYEFLDVTQRYGPVAVALNLEGRRFADESAGTGEEYLNFVIARQPEATAVYIVDDQIANLSEGMAPPRVAIERARACGGPVAAADTLESLCESIRPWGVAGGAALEALREFNAAIEGGAAHRLQPPRLKNHYALTRPPFTAVCVRPGITFTCGGLQTDTSMRVLQRASTISTLPLVTADVTEIRLESIGNLFAAGCDVGGISNRGYMGGLATALVTGRIAGSAAARC